MANTAALLGNLLSINADINYYTQQSISWNKLYEANSAKLEDQVNYEKKWEKAFDDYMDTDKKIDAYGFHAEKGQTRNESVADAYAHAKVKQYNEELLNELQDLDIEFDTMRQMMDTMLEELRAEKESAKTATSNAANDTGLLQGG